MYRGSLTFRTSAVRILCDTRVSYSLSFFPALVGTHLNPLAPEFSLKF